MASSGNPVIGYGSDINRSTDGITYNSVGKVLEIVPPKMKVKDIQITNLLSPLGFHEFRSGLRDPGEGSFKILFNKTDYNVVFGDWSGGVSGSITRFWKFLFSDQTNSTPSALAFSAYIRDLEEEDPLDDLVVAMMTFKVTGPVTFTQAN
jgi:hypothetical protein